MELRVLSDGSFVVVDNVTEPVPAAPSTPKRKADDTEPVAPPAPKKAVALARMAGATRSPVVDQVLAGLDQFPDDDEERFPEMFHLAKDLKGSYANYSLQRLITAYMCKLVAPGENSHEGDNFALHQLLLVCFGYASGSEEARTVLRETIKLPNFISKDKIGGIQKVCKTLMGHAYPPEKQPNVIGVMRGLGHLFNAVHILPTVYLNNRWVYDSVADCTNKAVSL